jgi:hypothetical protein
MYINRITSIPSEPAKSRLCSFTEESVECTGTSLNNKVVMGEKFTFSVPPGLRTIRRESSRTELYSVREVWVGIQSRPTIYTKPHDPIYKFCGQLKEFTYFCRSSDIHNFTLNAL